MKKYFLWGVILLGILRFCGSFSGSSSFPDLIEISTEGLNLRNYIDTGTRYYDGTYYGERLWKLMRDDEDLYRKFFQGASELRKEEIRKSLSFKTYKKNLKKELNRLLSYTYYLQLGYLGDYDIKSRKFTVLISDWQKKESNIAGYTFDFYSDALTHMNKIGYFWFDDIPFDIETGTYWGEPAFRKILEFPFPKDRAGAIERGTMYLVFNPVNELKNGYVRTKDIGLVVVRDHRTVYAAKISDFDHKTEWRKSPWSKH